MLDKNTFQTADVANYVNNYYAVKFNAEGNETINYKKERVCIQTQDIIPNWLPDVIRLQFGAVFTIQAYPTIVFMDEKGDVIAPIRGYQTPPQLELYLKMFKADEHKGIDTQEKVQRLLHHF